MPTSRLAPRLWWHCCPWTLAPSSRRWNKPRRRSYTATGELDNLGTDADGPTILLDWESTGRGAALSDLVWYLAINCRQIPLTREAAVAAYRTSLDRRGVDTAPWLDTQLAPCLLGATVQFGWEKALGGYNDELAWWEARALEAARLLV